jgi:flagellar basal body rod protein FlgB
LLRPLSVDALQASTSTDFTAELAKRTAQAQATEADLQHSMSELADTQIRYEADAKLLQAAYSRLRTAIRSNA